MTVFSDNENVLLMLSGGIDSTYLLYHYLRETRHAVHAHHVSIRYPHTERWRAEEAAVDGVVGWCRTHLRSFDYSCSGFELGFRRTGWDSDLILLAASKVALNLPRQRTTLALGWCVDDLERPLVRDREQRGVTARLWGSLCDSVHGLDLDRSVAMPIVDMGMRKVDVVAALPEALLRLTWSCRTPTGPTDGLEPCGVCHACELRERARVDIVASD